MRYYQICTLITVSLVSLTLAGDKCPSPVIDSGFGSFGKHTVESDTIPSELISSENIFIFKPAGTTEKAPCILFYPSYRSNGPIAYERFISFLVSKGYVVVFAPYKPLNFRPKDIEEYSIDLDAFLETVKPVHSNIDTSRIGFIGHGFGAGNLPALVKLVIEKMHWGANGIGMYLLSPWYFHGISKREMQNYYKKVTLIVQIFDNDNINDPRMGHHLFTLLNIARENKEFYYLYGDNKLGCRLKSDFSTPQGEEELGGDDNVLDAYGIYRTADAMFTAIFEKDTAAHKFAFGTGKTRELSMGSWPDGTPVKKMIATDKPEKFIKKKPYINMWTSPRNPYVERSNFRKTMKLYLSHNFRKVRNLARFVIKKKKADKNELPPVETFENPIDSGYGAPGIFSVAHDSVKNSVESPHPIYFFYPPEKDEPLSLIVLIHGYSGPDYLYFEPFINHMVSKGHVVLFPTYPSLPLATTEKKVADKIKIIKAGVTVGINTFKNKIDTSRIACMGQSFGGGMVPTVSHMLIVDKGWGNSAAFLFIMAPWYCCGITQEQLQSFPGHCKLVMQVYNDDLTNDHQIAVDVYNSINIPPDEKDFLTLYSDEFNGVTMSANHFVPYGTKNIYGEENLLDYYGVFRIFDALVDYSFNNNPEAKCVALGNGCKEQTFMGEWAHKRPFKPLRVTDAPLARQTPFQYFYPWDNPLNPRLILYTEKKKKGVRLLKLKKKISELKNRQ